MTCQQAHGIACLRYSLLTAKFPSAALAARCTSMSALCKRNRIGSRVSLSTSRTSRTLCKRVARYVGIIVFTSLSDFGKCQAGATLEIDIFRVHQGAQRPEGLAREEIGLSSLYSLSEQDSQLQLLIAKPTFSKYVSRSATASRSLSASAGSYNPSFDRPCR